MKADSTIFAGKTIFVGIDVHKATYSVAAVCDGEAVFKVGSMPASPERLVETLRSRFPTSRIRSAYEAGFSGFVLHRTLVASGIDNIVVHAAAIEVAANDRVKTDKRDALKIALHLSRGALVGIRVPTIEQELRRQLTRTRVQLVKERTRIGNKIKSRLVLFGYIEASDRRAMSPKLLRELRALQLPHELALAVSVLADIWDSIQEQIATVDKEIDAQAKKDDKIERIYRSVPGVGRLTARTLANELGDMSDFCNERQICSFVGLTPSEYSSGPNERKGNITRQGSSYIRYLLIEAAWTAIDKDPELQDVYNRIKTRRGGKRAIVAVSRRVIGRIRACLKTSSEYVVNHRATAS